MSVRSPNEPNLIEIRPLGVSRHIREKQAFVTFGIFFPSSCAQVERLNRF
jgi:hypothetical protein